MSWRAALNPLAALVSLARLGGVEGLVAVIGLGSLAQFILHNTWVLENSFRFGWGPPQNGASFFAFGVLAVAIQGGLLPSLLRRFGERRLVLLGLLSGTLTNKITRYRKEGAVVGHGA